MLLRKNVTVVTVSTVTTEALLVRLLRLLARPMVPERLVTTS